METHGVHPQVFAEESNELSLFWSNMGWLSHGFEYNMTIWVGYRVGYILEQYGLVIARFRVHYDNMGWLSSWLYSGAIWVGYRTVSSTILQIFSEFLVFCRPISQISEITAKHEKPGKCR